MPIQQLKRSSAGASSEHAPVFKKIETFWHKHKVKIGAAVCVGVALIITGIAIPAIAAGAVIALFTAAVIGTTAGVVGASIAGAGALIVLMSLLAVAYAFFKHPPKMFDPILIKECPYGVCDSAKLMRTRLRAFQLFKHRLELYHPQGQPQVSYSCVQKGNFSNQEFNIIKKIESDQGTRYQIIGSCCLVAFPVLHAGCPTAKITVLPKETWHDQPIKCDAQGIAIPFSPSVDEGGAPLSGKDTLEAPIRLPHDSQNTQCLLERAQVIFGERLKQHRLKNSPKEGELVLREDAFYIGQIVETSLSLGKDRRLADYDFTIRVTPAEIVFIPSVRWSRLAIHPLATDVVLREKII